MFEQNYGSYGSLLVTLPLLLFAFSTLLTWQYYGDRSTRYLSGDSKLAARVWQIFSWAAGFVGGIADTVLIWTISTVSQALMTLPNLFCMLMLRREIREDLEAYSSQLGQETASPGEVIEFFDIARQGQKHAAIDGLSQPDRRLLRLVLLVCRDSADDRAVLHHRPETPAISAVRPRHDHADAGQPHSRRGATPTPLARSPRRCPGRSAPATSAGWPLRSSSAGRRRCSGCG